VSVRALLAQLEPAAGDVGANLEHVRDALIAHPQAELAVFPELFLPGYDPRQASVRARGLDDPVTRSLSRAAADVGTALIVGFAERTPEGVANAAACIDADGRFAGSYRKTHLFGDAERRAFAPGERLLVVELAGRRIAPLICFDIEFPEPARSLARAGARLLVSIAANMAPYGPDHRLAARARALDNRLPHLYVNRVGSEAGLAFVGGSRAVDSAGRVVAEAGDGEQLLLVDLDLEDSTPDDVDYLRHARGELAVELAV
jgi:predicted amidohydrolase